MFKYPPGGSRVHDLETAKRALNRQNCLNLNCNLGNSVNESLAHVPFIMKHFF